MIDETPQQCRETAAKLRASGGLEPVAALLERAANRIETLNAARGRLLELVERARKQKQRGQRTSRGRGDR